MPRYFHRSNAQVEDSRQATSRHTRAVLSPDAVTTYTPSALTAAEDTKRVCPLSSRTGSPSASRHTRAV